MLNRNNIPVLTGTEIYRSTGQTSTASGTKLTSLNAPHTKKKKKKSFYLFKNESKFFIITHCKKKKKNYIILKGLND